MAELFSTAKAITTFHEASELIYIPATALTLWTAYHEQITHSTFNSALIAMFLCSCIAFIGCLIIYNIMCFISGWLYKYPIFPIFSVLLLSIGTIFIFQNSTGYLNQFIGITLLSWGCLLDLVTSRIRAAEDEVSKTK